MSNNFLNSINKDRKKEGSMNESHKKEVINRETLIDNYKQELEKSSLKIQDDLDTEHITSIINKLEEINPRAEEYSPMEALGNFRKNYMPRAEKQYNLLIEKELYAEKILKRKYSKFIYITKRIAVAMIIFICSLYLTNFIIYSFAGLNIFKPLVDWSHDTFNRRYNNSFSELISLEKKENVAILKPKYYLENFRITEATSESSKVGNVVRIKLTLENLDKFVSYTVQIVNENLDGYVSKIEKNANDVEILIKNDIIFYIFENNGWNVVTWDYMGAEYTLIGNISKDLLKKIIKSLEY